jgi:hypothetical protein
MSISNTSTSPAKAATDKAVFSDHELMALTLQPHLLKEKKLKK